MAEKCKSCGAGIEYSADSQSLKCPYCGAVNEIKPLEGRGVDGAAELIFPLAIKPDALDKQVYGFMAQDAYAPDDMLEVATFTKREFLYAPAYLFAVEYAVSWTASFGYDRQEPYTDYRTVTKDGKTTQEAYTAYRTVTDWRPASGTDAGEFSLLAYAGKSLLDSPLQPWQIIAELGRRKPGGFSPEFMTGIQSEAFAHPEDKVFAGAKGRVDAVIDANVRRHAQGDQQQDWFWKTNDLEHSAQTLYVPLCHAVFDYQGKEYHYWADGINGAAFRADKLPEDSGRKKTVSMSFIPFYAACAGLLVASLIWHFAAMGLLAVAGSALFGILRRNAIIGFSQTVRESLNLQIQASSTAVASLSAAEQAKFSKAYLRPEKPFLANTGNDALLIPVLSVVGFVAALLPACLK